MKEPAHPWWHRAQILFAELLARLLPDVVEPQLRCAKVRRGEKA
jgi:hypothetical protein